MSEFALHIQDIDEVGKDFVFPLTRAWLDSTLADAGMRADPAAATGSLSVHAQQNGAEYLLEGEVRASLVTDCGRCLAEAKVPVESRFATLFSRGSGGRPNDDSVEVDDDDDSELQHEEFSGHEIVLDDLIREYLVLEVPMQPLCSPDCQGIAVPAHVRPPEDVFGPSDGSVDPRLAPLLRLRDKVPPNKE